MMSAEKVGIKNRIKSEIKHLLTRLLKFLLSKIIIPVKKKKEVWLGNFRFSIAFRISLHYLKLLLISGLFFLVGLMLLFFISEYRSMNYKVMKTLNYIMESNQLETVDITNPLYIDDITVRLTNESDDVIFNDIQYDISKQSINGYSILDKIFYLPSDKILSPTIVAYDDKEITIKDKTYKLYIQYDMSDSTKQASWLLWTVGGMYLVVVYMIIRRGKISDLKLLEPITEMSNTANKLTVNNLDSKRLNVEGTKNELRDLAGVFNNMLDRLELSYESQKQFVSDASHELRTPISVIQGYAGLLKRWGTKDKDVLIESVDAISNEAKAMQDLVEKLLFLSRHDKKKLKLEKRKFRMNHVIEDMVKETRIVTLNRTIVSEIIDDVVVYGDRQALKQAIRVFIDNAVKYTKDGDTITINCENDNGDCVITVADTGMGMTRKDAEHIFERFYRSDEVRNERINGHGLGLSIAKLIILGHTGIIRVKTQFTKGTTFTIILPKRY